MGKYRGYEKYKDSGVEWLGEIPEHWEIKRLRFILKTNPSKNEIKLDKSNLASFVPMEAVGEYGGINLDIEKTIEDVFNGYTYFANNDVVIAKITPCFENGKSAIAYGLTNGIAFGTTELHVLRASHRLNNYFLFYLVISHLFRHHGEAEMYGAGGQKRVPENFIKNFRIAIPPLDEQEAIARFLDYKTKQIDDLIAKKETLIEKLDEKRTALISHAVTKGLDPNVPMKDSGIDWLGEISEHWLPVKLKYICSLLRDGTHLPPPRVNNGIPLLSVRNLVNDKFMNLDDDSLIAEEAFQELNKSFQVCENDILLAIVGATLGKVAIVEKMPKFTIQRSLAILRPKQGKCLFKFLFYFIKSPDFQKLLWLNTGYSAQPGIYLGSLANFFILIPPIVEQQAIVTYLDQKIAKIDQQKAKIKEAIELLKEYRTALITNAVTGKIDVRQFPIP
jgi:type I restriction enzyme, S subunit